MRTWFWPAHAEHDPSVLAPPPGSDPAYYADSAERGVVLLDALRRAGLGEVSPPPGGDLRSDIAMVHHPAMLSFLTSAHRRHVASMPPGFAGEPDRDAFVPETFAVGTTGTRSPSLRGEAGWFCFDTSSPIFARTLRAATGAVGCAVAAADDLLAGQRAAYALCRPPGHHATSDRYGGFCYLNNAAIAARRLSTHGRRVAVIDVDAHHGNGTQDIFWNDPGVFVASLHMDPEVEYPYHWGYEEEIGGEDAEGTNLNLPLPLGCVEPRYLVSLDMAIAQATHFGADALVVSLGTDGHRNDPVGGFDLTTSTYRRIGERFAEMGLSTVVVQEGGYHLASLAECVLGVLRPLAATP